MDQMLPWFDESQVAQLHEQQEALLLKASKNGAMHSPCLAGSPPPKWQAIPENADVLITHGQWKRMPQVLRRLIV